jgi:hypothetical protein
MKTKFPMILSWVLTHILVYILYTDFIHSCSSVWVALLATVTSIHLHYKVSHFFALRVIWR